MAADNRWVWMDLEMTGLNPEQDRILELAVLITDYDLNVVAEGPVWVVHQSDDVLNGMDEWCTRTHGESGLTERVRNSTLDEAGLQAALLEFLQSHVAAGSSPLCGNSIWQDRRFIARYLPEVDQYLHYRMIDVSTLKELAKRWQPEMLKGFRKLGSHQALTDIQESIAELRFYREHFLIPAAEQASGDQN
ncbi:oligoribonuclease [Pokkaliibacter plantistimulans]|uniref:Oligoribonuclease n=2 Tax=Pseudomonadota TaxID=1224 RepID=A0ABX5LZ76_9GAMM|nr:oligoribonuclease [Pokkaliibacter plantistimulans]PPC74423.1 oligoribonuclease [Pokkaliibacter plantistimulans]PXF31992.1 oligoribonuclease [Pokkaliibacter plantistimulans]